VMDEVADMKPMVWGEIVRPMLADRSGWAIFIGTPKGINLFSQLYYAALEGLEGWAADLKRANETDALSEQEIADMRATMSPSQQAQELDCDFAAAVENTLLPLPAVLDSQKRHAPEDLFSGAAKILGVDVARYGDDRTVLFPRQGRMAFQPKTFRQLSLMETVGQVAMSIEKWKPDAVFVDQTGLGAGVVDRLRELGHEVQGVDFGSRALRPTPRLKNRRAEMWWTMAEWVKDGGCLPRVAGLAEELTAPTYRVDSNQVIQLESKDDMKARGLPSPDIADALALTFAAPVTKSASLGLGAAVLMTARTDFDPYEEH